jgi:MFS family permease
MQPQQDPIKSAPKKAKLFSRLNPWASIPRPYHTWVVLGAISFIAVFAWRFVEPQFHFFIYDTLGWTSAGFGLAMSGYALLMVFAQTVLGSLSDRFGRRPVLALGLIVHTAQYVALIATRSPIWIALGIAGSGLGEGLFMPALNATYLDLAPEQGRSRAIGFKECMFSLGGLAGPALVVVVTRYLQPATIFIIGGALILGSAFLVPLMSHRTHIQASVETQHGLGPFHRQERTNRWRESGAGHSE